MMNYFVIYKAIAVSSDLMHSCSCPNLHVIPNSVTVWRCCCRYNLSGSKTLIDCAYLLDGFVGDERQDLAQPGSSISRQLSWKLYMDRAIAWTAKSIPRPRHFLEITLFASDADR